MRKSAQKIHGVIDSTVGTPPLLRRWNGLRELAPLAERGKAARFEARVDEYGKPIAKSIRIHGIGDAAYEAKLRHQYREHVFTPARINWCNVEGDVVLVFDVRDNGEINPPALQFRGRYEGSIVTVSLGPECADVRARVRTKTLLVTDTVIPVNPLEMILPPMPTPAKLSGKPLTFSVRIDSSGSAIDSTITLTPFEPASYRKRVLEAMRGITYRPAILQGCGVEAPFSLTMTLSGRA